MAFIAVMSFIGKALHGFAAGAAMQAFAAGSDSSVSQKLGVINPQLAATALITQLNLAGGAATKAGARINTAGGGGVLGGGIKGLDAERAQVQRHLAGCSAGYIWLVEAFARFQRAQKHAADRLRT